ncbi:MAG: hypothetical protein K2Q07_08865, partial [Burkholderiaceae bacterium]|nr:hypothetical protein [Burkholderiaceae bacterium]
MNNDLFQPALRTTDGLRSGRPVPGKRVLIAAAAALTLAGCASTAIDQNFRSVQKMTQERLGSEVKWLTNDEARRQAQTDADALLTKPLGADDAVRLALTYSPALQA